MSDSNNKEYSKIARGCDPTSSSANVSPPSFIPGVPGDQGIAGEEGQDGRGITSTELINNGNGSYSIKLTYTDFTTFTTNSFTPPKGLKGDNGTNGLSINWRNSYVANPSPIYKINDAVFYQGSSYIAIVDSPTGLPSANTSEWSLLSKKGDTGPQGPSGTAQSIMAKSYTDAIQTVVLGQTVIVDFEKNSFNGSLTPSSSTVWAEGTSNRFNAVVNGVWGVSANIKVTGVSDGEIEVEVVKNGTTVLARQTREIDDIGELSGPEAFEEEIIYIDITAYDYSDNATDYYDIRVKNVNNTETVSIDAGLGNTWAVAGRWTSQDPTGEGPNGGLTVLDFRKNAADSNILELEYDQVGSSIIQSVDLNSNFADFKANQLDDDYIINQIATKETKNAWFERLILGDGVDSSFFVDDDGVSNIQLLGDNNLTRFSQSGNTYGGLFQRTQGAQMIAASAVFHVSLPSPHGGLKLRDGGNFIGSPKANFQADNSAVGGYYWYLGDINYYMRLFGDSKNLQLGTNAGVDAGYKLAIFETGTNGTLLSKGSNNSGVNARFENLDGDRLLEVLNTGELLVGQNGGVNGSIVIQTTQANKISIKEMSGGRGGVDSGNPNFPIPFRGNVIPADFSLSSTLGSAGNRWAGVFGKTLYIGADATSYNYLVHLHSGANISNALLVESGNSNNGNLFRFKTPTKDVIRAENETGNIIIGQGTDDGVSQLQVFKSDGGHGQSIYFTNSDNSVDKKALYIEGFGSQTININSTSGSGSFVVLENTQFQGIIGRNPSNNNNKYYIGQRLTGVDDIGFYTGAANVLRALIFGATGNIGIGTNTDTNYRLSIDSGSQDGLKVKGKAGGVVARFEDNNALSLVEVEGNVLYLGQRIFKIDFSDLSGGELSYHSGNGGGGYSHDFYAGSQHGVRITRDGLSVKRGLNNPVEALDVGGNAIIDGTIKTGDIGATAAPTVKIGAKKVITSEVPTGEYLELEIDGTIVKVQIVA